MFQIKARFTGAVLFECELAAEVADKEYGVRLGFAVKKAVKARADLAGANLARANLAGAYLADANLARANLAGAYLADANLARANLARADLARADLARANLAGAYLADADLAGASGALDLGCPDGWRSVAYLAPDGIMRVRVGCRDKSIAEGREYWSGKNNRREVMAALDHAEVIALLRGWKVE